MVLQYFKQTRETFETYTEFPRYKPTSNNYSYPDGTKVSITSSGNFNGEAGDDTNTVSWLKVTRSIQSQSWYGIWNNGGDYWVSSGFNGGILTGSAPWLQVDIGETITLKEYIISFYEPLYRPINFKLFAYVSNRWIVIHENNSNYTFDASIAQKTVKFSIPNNTVKSSIYKIEVYKIGTANKLVELNLRLFGVADTAVQSTQSSQVVVNTGDSLYTQYPRYPATSENYTYPDGTRVITSASSNYYWQRGYNDILRFYSWNAFNQDYLNRGEGWASNGGFTYNGGVLTGPAQWLQINLGEEIILKEHKITFSDPKKGPSTFKVYAYVSNQWTIIQEVNNFVYTNMTNLFQIPSNNLKSSTYKIEVYKLTGNEILVGMNWKLFGIQPQSVKTVTLRCDAFSMPGVCCNGGWPSYPISQVRLPDDYDDGKLISWDIDVYAWKNSSNFGLLYGIFYLNIGQFGLPDIAPFDVRQHTNSYKNRTTPLIINGSRYITGSGGVWSYPLLSNCYYVLTIRYSNVDLAKQKAAQEAQQKADIMRIDNVSDSTAVLYLNEKNAQIALQKAIDTYNKTATEISVLQKEYENRKANLNKQISDQNATIDADFIRMRIEMQQKEALLNQKNVESQRLLTAAIQKEADAERERIRILTETNNKNNLITVTQTDLNKLRNDAMAKFGDYMTASDKSQLAQISYMNATKAYELIKVGLQAAKKVVEDDLAGKQALFVMEAAKLDAEKKKVDETNARIIAERIAIELDNKQKEFLIQQQQNANKTLQDNTKAEQIKLEIATNNEQIALQQKKQAENNTSLLLDQMNTKYGTNYSRFEELNTLLDTKIAAELQKKVAAEKEEAAQRVKELQNVSIEASANAIINVNNQLISEAQKSITYYDGLIKSSSQELTGLITDRKKLENNLVVIISTAQTMKEIADQKYKELDIRTQLEINKLNQERKQLQLELATQSLKRDQLWQTLLHETSTKDTLERTLNNRIDVVNALNNELEYYYDLTKDYNIPDLLEDVDSQILYNINTSINKTNSEMVLPRLRNELNDFEKRGDTLGVMMDQAKNDVNVSNVDSRSIEAGNNLMLSIAFIISLTSFLYLKVSSQLAIIIFSILMVLSLIVYNVRLNTIVRTKAKNYYWSEPIKAKKL